MNDDVEANAGDDLHSVDDLINCAGSARWYYPRIAVPTLLKTPLILRSFGA